MHHDIDRETMNGLRYTQILNEQIVPQFTQQLGMQWIYQLDGASSHFNAIARAVLDKNIAGRWIEWPSRSPDLTAFDYWLWPYVGRQVYDPLGFKFQNINELQRGIEEVLNGIPLAMFRRTMTDFPKRIERCLEAGGDLFEGE